VVTGADLHLPEIAQRYADRRSPFWDDLPARQPPLVIARNGVGTGVVARRSWASGDSLIPILWGDRLPAPSRWTIQLGARQHAEPGPFELRFVNHSCAPNVIFDIEAGALRALRRVDPGDELRCFYPATEWDMAETFECRCGAAECLGSIAGAGRMDTDKLRGYELSGFVRTQLNGGSGSDG
jgi:hypothetical protein